MTDAPVDGATAVVVVFTGIELHSSDGKLVTAGSVDNSLRIWDATTGEDVVVRWSGVGDRVRGVAFSPDGKTLATATMDYFAEAQIARELMKFFKSGAVPTIKAQGMEPG